MDEMKTCIEPESLIEWVEQCKTDVYEEMGYIEGQDNPEVLAQVTNRILGMQRAFDIVIKHIREMQTGKTE